MTWKEIEDNLEQLAEAIKDDEGANDEKAGEFAAIALLTAGAIGVRVGKALERIAKRLGS